MYAGKQNGRDYTPLFKFLLSKVGEDWSDVYSEAVARLDRPDPIFWIVAQSEIERRAIVGFEENTWYNGLYVDEANILRMVDPDARIDPQTYKGYGTATFNGQPFFPARPK